MGDVQTMALLSPCGRYRNLLVRSWGHGARAVFLMLNPSTADATADDPTIRKCMGFARRWGLTGITVVNLYALRAAKPEVLRAAQRAGEDVHGPSWESHLALAAEAHDTVIVAWGAHEPADSPHSSRCAELVAVGAGRFPARPLHCLGRTKAGQPRHPLMLPYTTPLEPWP